MIVSNFPQALELNSILYDRVCKNIHWEKTQDKDSIFGRKTGWDLHKQNIKEVNTLLAWIKGILPEISIKFADPQGSEKYYNFNRNAFEIRDCWGTHYNKGESLVKHNHFPYTLSFVYYVKTPKGFSPLLIEEESIDVKEGQCIFFLAHQFHSVPANNCDGRCIIAGNIFYRFSKRKEDT